MTLHLATQPDPDQLDLLTLVADPYTPLGTDDLARFKAACAAEAQAHGGDVNPSGVRARLMVAGELSIAPRRFSALWSVATGKDGWLDNTDVFVPITGAGSKHNGGKSVRLRRWRT